MNKHRTGRAIGAAVGVVIAMAFVASPLAAHHGWYSWAMDRTFSLTGKVVKIEWTNPHSFLYFDVQDGKDGVTHWQVETGSINNLVRKGWNQDSLKVGDEVSVRGHPDKANDGKGRQLGLASQVMFADKKILIGNN